MAAIRDGLGRVRVAGEAIYQRETLLEGCFAPDRWWPLPPPFLVLPLFTSPSSTPFSLPPSPPPISPASFLVPVPGTHSITTTPLTRPRTAPGSVLESINVTGDWWKWTRRGANGRSGNGGKSNGGGWERKHEKTRELTRITPRVSKGEGGRLKARLISAQQSLYLWGGEISRRGTVGNMPPEVSGG